jgi:hypothetical protein
LMVALLLLVGMFVMLVGVFVNAGI